MSQPDTDRAEPRKPRLSLGRLRVALPLIAGLLALLSLWLAYSGWRQWQDENRSHALQQSRDLAVQSTGRALQLEQAQVWPADLQAAYRGLPQTGFGRLAVAEAALVANAPVARIAKEAGGARLVLAAPARAGGRLAGIAYVRLPLTVATGGLGAVHVGQDSYLALRQGNYSVLERGDPALATSAEALAAKVAGTDLRIAASLPDATRGAFGLGAMASFVAAAVLAGLALLTWLIARRGGDHIVVADSRDEAEPTLAQTMRQAPAPPRPSPVIEIKDAPKAAPVKIDRSIFRAYDIRGVVGTSLDAGVAELIGQAVGSLMFEKDLHEIVVGRDGRLSGPDLTAALTEGLRKAGCNVIDIGLAPTPLVYFGTY
ncbi:MAG: phosphomannomutase/phosphoglucomutase, partial [Gammaproteobacteria bacterium]|nr:phosphomannomutase/phosphoglucomutase [Gammaproteobacteria bacterium]